MYEDVKKMDLENLIIVALKDLYRMGVTDLHRMSCLKHELLPPAACWNPLILQLASALLVTSELVFYMYTFM